MSTKNGRGARIRVLAAVVVWVVWTLVATSSQVTARRMDPTWSMGRRGAVIKMTADATQMAAAPAWVPIWMIVRGRGMDSPPMALLSNALAAGGWIGIALAGDGIRRKMNRRRRAAGRTVNMARRRLIVNAAFGGAAFASMGGFANATVLEPWNLKVRRYRIPVRGLAKELHGLRIVQLSDTHLGPRVPATHIRAAIEIAMDLKPDLVALTGDYIHTGEKYIDAAAGQFRALAETFPTVGVLGNHDWYGNGPRMSLALQTVGVRMIDNGRVYFDRVTRGFAEMASAGSLCVAGLGDLTEDHVDIEAGLGGVGIDVARVVLAHNPDTAEVWEVANHERIDLMLSGHTHGGQVCLPFIGAPVLPSAYGQKYAGGLVDGPGCRVVVSRGVGMSLMPIRIGVPPEVVEVELVEA